jgi:hypothetical protein
LDAVIRNAEVAFPSTTAFTPVTSLTTPATDALPVNAASVVALRLLPLSMAPGTNAPVLLLQLVPLPLFPTQRPEAQGTVHQGINKSTQALLRKLYKIPCNVIGVVWCSYILFYYSLSSEHHRCRQEIVTADTR